LQVKTLDAASTDATLTGDTTMQTLTLSTTTLDEHAVAAAMLVNFVRAGVTFRAEKTRDGCELIITFLGGF
jgi:hypothetical protein